MLSGTIQAALNAQINEEIHSAYIYLAMAAESDRLGLPGFNNWFKKQYSEELSHADRFFNYILERGGEVKTNGDCWPQDFRRNANVLI